MSRQRNPRRAHPQLTTLDLGGTITGEHAVGALKRPWLVGELGEAQVDLQRSVKAVFDPLGLLAPASFLAREEGTGH